MDTKPLLCMVVVVIATVHAQIAPTQIPLKWHWSQFPNPQNEFGRCGRNKPSYICDPNHLISYKGANAIDRLINQTLTDSTCPCGAQSCIRSKRSGYQIAVAIVPEFYTSYNGSNPDRLLLETRRFAYGIYSRRWSFGVCGEWVLLFYTQQQNIVYTLTGRLARSTLNDALLEQITLDARHFFAAGPQRNITQGLLQMVEDFRNVFLTRYQRRPFVRAARLYRRT
ncbi:uncharacterized protein LOC135481992 [Liolophura sinensis]|uniref:uncharacterized protein LOC135481992 n=1 Tax=Liolophura sinensis TaxID=3198878 RepID=UPI003158BA84